MSRSMSRWVTFTLALVSPVLAETATMLSGHWVQMLSDRFVQSTTEIDWHCVQADIRPAAASARAGGNHTLHYTLTKTARLHAPDGPPVTTPEVEMVLQEDQRRVRLRRPLLLDGKAYETYAVRRLTPDMLVLTGEDDADASLYVFVRDADTFDADEGGERITLETELAAWGYTDLAGYKAPRGSYDARECAARNSTATAAASASAPAPAPSSP